MAVNKGKQPFIQAFLLGTKSAQNWLMKFIEAANFATNRPWGALDIVTMTGATSVRPHWSDQPYRWHINDGEKVSMVVDGAVDIHYRDAGQECIHTLTPNTICFAEAGNEHVAHPRDETRMLTIEKEGSIQPTATATDSVHLGIPITALLPQLGKELIMKFSRSIVTVIIGAAVVLGAVAAPPTIAQATSCPFAPVHKYEERRLSGSSTSADAFKIQFDDGVYIRLIVETLDLVGLQVNETQIAYAGDITYKDENGNFWVK